jgi:hypothetical protein
VVSPSLGYGQMTPYAALPPGRYTVTIRDPRRRGRGAPVLTGALTLRSEAAYTVTALGTTATARIRALQDDLTPAAPGRARVRVISAADVGAVDVAAAGGPVLVRNLGFARPTGYADVPARSWRLRVSATGTATSVTPVRLRRGTVYTLLVLRAADGADVLRVRTLVDAVGSARTPTAGPDTGYGGAAGTVSTPSRG